MTSTSTIRRNKRNRRKPTGRDLFPPGWFLISPSRRKKSPQFNWGDPQGSRSRPGWPTPQNGDTHAGQGARQSPCEKTEQCRTYAKAWVPTTGRGKLPAKIRGTTPIIFQSTAWGFVTGYSTDFRDSTMLTFFSRKCKAKLTTPANRKVRSAARI